MRALKKLDNRVSYRISRAKGVVFVRADFKDLAAYDQVGRSLKKMVERGKLMKLGYGLYVKAQTSSISGQTIPVKPLPELARESLERLNRQIAPSRFERAYNAGSTEQVPTGRVIAVVGRISRKIGYDGKYMTFERA